MKQRFFHQHFHHLNIKYFEHITKQWFYDEQAFHYTCYHLQSTMVGKMLKVNWPQLWQTTCQHQWHFWRWVLVLANRTAPRIDANVGKMVLFAPICASLWNAQMMIKWGYFRLSYNRKWRWQRILIVIIYLVILDITYFKLLVKHF